VSTQEREHASLKGKGPSHPSVVNGSNLPFSDLRK